MPLFALANTGIPITGNGVSALLSPNSLGVLAGLFIGKPLGIVLASFLAIKMRLSRLSDDILWSHILGAGFLGGIGFTMSIFITLLAFQDSEIIRNTKISILVSSLLAGVMGYFILRRQKGIVSNDPA
jgi:NhaA family Na+:H+ antiporter